MTWTVKLHLSLKLVEIKSPDMGVNVRIGYERPSSGGRRLMYFIIKLSFEYPTKSSQCCTGVVEDDVLPVRASSAYCPVAGTVCGGEDRLPLSSPSVV